MPPRINQAAIINKQARDNASKDDEEDRLVEDMGGGALRQPQSTIAPPKIISEFYLLVLRWFLCLALDLPASLGAPTHSIICLRGPALVHNCYLC